MDLRQRGKGQFEGSSPGIRRAERNTADEPLKVIDRGERRSQIRAKLMLFLNSATASSGVRSPCLHQRVQKPFAQFPAAHRRDRKIQHTRSVPVTCRRTYSSRVQGSAARCIKGPCIPGRGTALSGECSQGRSSASLRYSAEPRLPPRYRTACRCTRIPQGKLP